MVACGYTASIASGKHRGNLPFGAAVNPRVGPMLFPVIEIVLRRGEAVELLAFQGRLLRMADAGLHIAFAIGTGDPAGKGDHVVMRQEVTIERVQRRIVEVGSEHALAQIVQDDEAWRAVESGQRGVMQFAPNAAAGLKGEQADALMAVAERQHEQVGAAILAGAGIAHQRTLV